MAKHRSGLFDRSCLIVLDESPVSYSWRVALQHCSLPLRLPQPSWILTARSSSESQRTATVSKLVCLTLGVQSMTSCLVLKLTLCETRTITSQYPYLLLHDRSEQGSFHSMV